jgi:mRNA interferase MazF
MPDQGDIVLVPVPFTDLSVHKQRPVIVISNDAYNHRTTDIVVVAMTSNPAQVDYSFVITSSDLLKGQLNHPGTIRVDKLYTLSQSIVTRTFGRVTPAVLDRIRDLLTELVACKAQACVFGQGASRLSTSLAGTHHLNQGICNGDRWP